MKKYTLFIICTLLTGLLFTTCEPWIVPEAVFVNFNANGGQGDMKALRFMDGEKQLLTKNTYTRNGYIFDGWNTRSDGRGQSYTDRQNVTITKSVTLYAQWTKIYKVHFNANGGTGTMAAQTFVAGVSQAITANAFTRSGYTFTGWNTNADGSGTFYTDKQSITLSQNITLYAQWKKDIVNYTVTFNANGGSGTMAAQTFEAGVSQAIAANAFTRSGYTFTGWNTAANGSGTSYTDKQSITLSQNITLYAQWKKDIVNYTLTFNANGGTGTMAAQTFEAGVLQAIAANAFTRSGYTFTGWNTKADGSGNSYTDGQEIALSQDITLYAQWNQEQVVSGTENGHDYVDLGLPSGTKWAICNLGATAPEGYGDYFAWGEIAPKDDYSWETYKYCNGSETSLTKYCDNSSYGYNGFTDNKTILDLSDDAARANWGGKWRMPTKAEQDELRNNCTWTLTTQNGVKGYKVTSKTNGNSIFLPAAGTRIGTSVSGVGSYGYYWSSSLKESAPDYAYDFSFTSFNVGCYISSRYVGRTVRALFSDNDKPSTFVTLTFNANGGTGTMAAQTFEAGVSQAIKANTFTRSGYTFTGWNTKADGSGTSYTDKQSITLSQNITLYAQWKKVIVNYTLTFNANGGTGTMAAQTFEAGVSQAITANTFTRSGYTFTGWNTNADGSGTSYTDGQEITLSQDITLYAQWNHKQVVSGTENGHDYVDLGLSVKWATCNVGATTPDGYGDYFAWGETAPKTNYDWSTYKYCNGSSSTLTKYNTESSRGTVDNKTTLEISDDAARAYWGGSWRMPSEAELDELLNNCIWTWSVHNGVEGYKVTSKTNGNSIFLPEAGEWQGASFHRSRGYYRSSSLLNGNSSGACGLRFAPSFVERFDFYRCYGRSVRAVFSDNDKPSTFVTLTFNANGGTGTMAAQTFEAGVSQAITANTFTRSGYTFTGWNTNADGSGTSYTDGQEITLSQDITLYAQWYQEQVVSGTENGHDYVDLGLPSGLKWATCNVGATTPEGYGDYFAWGETEPKTNYDWSTYKYCNGSSSTLTKYNTESSRGTVDNKTILELSDDAARANWGGTWRMPTEAELDELLNNCTWTWALYNGVEGYKVTSKTNGNSIFLPEAGEWQGASFHRSRGYYRSSSLLNGNSSGACGLRFAPSFVERFDFYRCYGRSVRAVFSDNDKPSTFVTLTFNANGGTGTMAAQTFEAGVSQAITANAFTRSGYTFTGWNTNADGSGTSYTDKQSITLTQDITLYAQWKKDIVNYTITFNANGGSGAMAAQTFEAGVSQAITANTFTRSGYTFTGWNTKADGSGTSYTDKQSITLTQDITLYAQWKSTQVVSGTENGHDYVDLGLPSGLKWATCNVGATTPESYGDYFAWGETEPKTNYDWSTYKYCNGSSSTLTKYNTDSRQGSVDNKTTLDFSDDAARANWGGKWRIPTIAEQDELSNNCTWTWTTQNGVNGYKVISKTNGNSIFLPAAGGRYGTSVSNVGSDGDYWSSSLSGIYPYYAIIMYFFDSDYVDWYHYGNRYIGLTVRAVCP